MTDLEPNNIHLSQNDLHTLVNLVQEQVELHTTLSGDASLAQLPDSHREHAKELFLKEVDHLKALKTKLYARLHEPHF